MKFNFTYFEDFYVLYMRIAHTLKLNCILLHGYDFFLIVQQH